MVTTPVVAMFRQSISGVHKHSFTNEGPFGANHYELRTDPLSLGFEEYLSPLLTYTGCVREVLSWLYGYQCSYEGFRLSHTAL